MAIWKYFLTVMLNFEGCDPEKRGIHVPSLLPVSSFNLKDLLKKAQKESN